MDSGWLSVREVARRLGKSEKVVRRAIHRGDLAAYELDGRAFSVAPADLESFIARCRVGGNVAAAAARSGHRAVCGS